MYCNGAVSCRDMDEWSLALLSCKIFMKGFETGAYIKRTGDPSEFAYIVLAGSCKVPNQVLIWCLYS